MADKIFSPLAAGSLDYTISLQETQDVMSSGCTNDNQTLIFLVDNDGLVIKQIE